MHIIHHSAKHVPAPQQYPKKAAMLETIRHVCLASEKETLFFRRSVVIHDECQLVNI